MKVTIQTAIAGHADPVHGLERDFAFNRGQEVELPDGLAAKWIASKIAIPAIRTPPPAAVTKSKKAS